MQAWSIYNPKPSHTPVYVAHSRLKPRQLRTSGYLSTLFQLYRSKREGGYEYKLRSHVAHRQHKLSSTLPRPTPTSIINYRSNCERSLGSVP